MNLLLFLSFCCFDSLPNTALLHQSIDSFYAAQLDAELAEFQTIDQKEWLKYLPTLGLTYSLDGKPRPTLSWSSNLIFSQQKKKEQIAAKKGGIQKKVLLARDRDKAKLVLMLQKFYALKQDIDFAKQLLAYDTRLYEARKDQELHLEISPIEFLKIEQGYRKKQFDLVGMEGDLEALGMEVLMHCHFFY